MRACLCLPSAAEERVRQLTFQLGARSQGGPTTPSVALPLFSASRKVFISHNRSVFVLAVMGGDQGELTIGQVPILQPSGLFKSSSSTISYAGSSGSSWSQPSGLGGWHCLVIPLLMLNVRQTLVGSFQNSKE